MKIEIREGYDVVITAETERERKQLEHLNDKYANCGVTFDLIGAPGFFHQIVLRPKDPEEQIVELGG